MYEYKKELGLSEKELNKLARDNWELVFVVVANGGYSIEYILKRDITYEITNVNLNVIPIKKVMGQTS